MLRLLDRDNDWWGVSYKYLAKRKTTESEWYFTRFFIFVFGGLLVFIPNHFPNCFYRISNLLVLDYNTDFIRERC